LVREIDALGGEMAKTIDKTYIQSRMLNLGKGAAVHSLRAQADKVQYSNAMLRVLENAPNLELYQVEIVDIIIENGTVTGVVDEAGQFYPSSAVVICTGTYIASRCLYGDVIIQGGAGFGRMSAMLSPCLQKHGIKLQRFKTGTPARVDGRTLDFTKMERQTGDENPTPFSFETEKINRPQQDCWLTYTNERTHDIIKANIGRSPMYSGVIEGTGTRYCPSIEDKISRFADKDRHQVFVEPEGNGNEMYVQGMSTSLPIDVQREMYRTLAGLENVVITRPGYAIEYDCLEAGQLKLSLEFKDINGLFAAGQFVGSSGYEEAAAQGLVAGINAVKYTRGESPLVLDRSQAYIGVLIDDLVTKGTQEPYRMMTSRAEYRLLLRQDNADRRLTEIGYTIGLISQERYDKFNEKYRIVDDELARIQKLNIAPSEKVNGFLKKMNSPVITTGVKLAELIKRPELNYESLAEIDPERSASIADNPVISEQINITIKYEGYIRRQNELVDTFRKSERKLLPKDVDYSTMDGLRLEARQKLAKVRPENIGQASRISGVSPADIAVLLLRLAQL
jgi:tRNA uridine 5-carboxymethylaminomethyl modification enzyme